MGRTVLIVEDDKSVARLLADVLEADGYQALIEADGEWGLRTFQHKDVDLVITDVLLPKLVGFDLVEQLRALEKGRTTPIIMLSGVYRASAHQQKMIERFGVRAYFDKPVDIDRLLDVVRTSLPLMRPSAGALRPPTLTRGASLLSRTPSVPPGAPPRAPTLASRTPGLGSPAAIPPASTSPTDARALGRVTMRIELAELGLSPELDAALRHANLPVPRRGDLEELPFARLLGQLYSARATGALMLRKSQVKKIVYLRQGVPIFVKSNLLGECLGHIMVRERLISQQQCDRSVERLKTERRPQGQILIDMGAISPHNLEFALERQLELKLYDLFSWLEGKYLFNEKDEHTGTAVALSLSPAEMVFEGVRRTMSAERVRKELARIQDRIPLPANDPTFRYQALELNPRAERLLDAIDGRARLQDLLARELLPGEQGAVLLYALISTSLVRLLDAPAMGRLPGAEGDVIPLSEGDVEILETGEIDLDDPSLHAIAEARAKARQARERALHPPPVPQPVEGLGFLPSLTPGAPIIPSEPPEDGGPGLRPSLVSALVTEPAPPPPVVPASAGRSPLPPPVVPASAGRSPLPASTTAPASSALPAALITQALIGAAQPPRPPPVSSTSGSSSSPGVSASSSSSHARPSTTSPLPPTPAPVVAPPFPSATEATTEPPRASAVAYARTAGPQLGGSAAAVFEAASALLGSVGVPDHVDDTGLNARVDPTRVAMQFDPTAAPTVAVPRFEPPSPEPSASTEAEELDEALEVLAAEPVLVAESRDAIRARLEASLTAQLAARSPLAARAAISSDLALPEPVAPEPARARLDAVAVSDVVRAQLEQDPLLDEAVTPLESSPPVPLGLRPAPTLAEPARPPYAGSSGAGSFEPHSSAADLAVDLARRSSPPAAPPSSSSSPRSSSPPAGMTPSGSALRLDLDKDKQRRLDELRALRARLEPLDAYARLGLDTDAEAADVTEAFEARARVHHPDRSVPGSASRELRALAEEVYLLFVRARDTLLSPEARRQLDRQRDPHALPHRVEAQAIRAEGLFQAGLVHLDAGALPQAFEALEEAVALAPDEGVYSAYRAWTTFMLAPDEAEVATGALAELERATALSPRAEEPHVFAGLIQEKLGRREDATRSLRRALVANPDSVRALRALRALAPPVEKKTGIFARFSGG